MSPTPAPLRLLDGPLGTALEDRGAATPLPLWSAAPLADQPELVAAIHADYARAGASVHATATFRTTARALAGSPWAERWRELARRAVDLCREGAGPGGTVAGSLAPLEDCWHPERTPDEPALTAEHGALAECLAQAGVDLLLVETMPSTKELVAATRVAVATGLPVWSALTLGPRGDFFDGPGVLDAAARAADAGAQAFLINCTPADAITPLLEALATSPHRPALLGAYGNAIFPGGERWTPEAYLAEARRWRAAGASLIGGCCGTTADHVRALAQGLD